MLTDPRVSACVVLYHSGEEAMHTVRCLLDSEEPVEIFVVDNSPKDGIGEQIHLRYLSVNYSETKKNLGYGRANNTVIESLTSRYHLILNPDVTFAPDLIGRMVAFMDTHDDVVILSPKVFNPDGTEQFLPRRKPTVRYLLGGRRALRSEKVLAKAQALREKAAQTDEAARASWAENRSGGGFRSLMRGNRQEMALTLLTKRAAYLEKKAARMRAWRDEYTLADPAPTEPMEIQLATGCFLMIRTHTFYRMRGFDPRFFLYHEDSDLSMSAAVHGKIVYHPDMHVTHTWHRDSAHKLLPLLRHIRSSVLFFHKWGWRW